MLSETIAVVLAGGQGSRLAPLTRDRAKPAVPFGGKYRIIDFTLANCLHSGLRRVLVLTQYRSHSLQKHLRDGWSIFNPELGEYITTVPPQMNTGQSWYSGTADAVYQNLYLLRRSGARTVVILSGDHIYRMDYAAMLAFHAAHGGVLTVAGMPVAIEQAGQFGVIKANADGRVEQFVEKPTDAQPYSDDGQTVMASMGIYVISIDFLLDALEADAQDEQSSHDFGHDIIPRAMADQVVHAYRFGSSAGRVSADCYWRDVGTLDSYYQANMDLLEPVPALDLYQPDWPIRSYQLQSPPARTVPGPMGNEGLFLNSIAAGGVIVAGGNVQHSILSRGVFIDDDACVHNAILLDDVRVGERALLQNCIIDKDVVIPPDEKIGYDQVHDAERFTVSEDGVVVVPRGYRFGD